MLPRRSPLNLVLLIAWLAWCGWIVAHYFTIPADSPGWREPGELFPPPHGGEAALRASLGLAGALAVLLAAWTCGTLLLRRLRAIFVNGLERVVFELALGLGALSYVCLGLAFAGLYRPSIVVPLTIALAAAGIALLRPRIPHLPVSKGRLHVREGVLIVCAVVAAGFALAGALAPETEFDALWYHLWLPARWLAAGQPVDVISEYVSLYPLTWELLYGVAMAIGGDVAAKLLHCVCLLLVGVTAGMFSRYFFRGSSAAVAGALAISVPLMIWEGTSAYIDLALAWYLVTSAYALVRYDDTQDRRWLVVAGLVTGIALAIKNLALVFLAIAGAFFFIRQMTRTSVRDALRAAVLLGMLAMLVPSPWYVRAWLRSGNPVFPDLYGVFGAQPPERWDADTERELRKFKDHFGRGRSLPHLLALPWDVTMHGTRYGGTLGPVFLMLVPVALVGAFRREDSRERVIVLALGIAAYGLVWASPISSFQMRFLVPIVPFLAVLGAEGLRRLPSGAWPLIALLLVWNLPPFTPWHEADRRGWSGWLTQTMRLVPLPVLAGAESRDAYLARKVPSYRAWQYIDAHATAGATVLTFSGGDHFYSRTERIWSDSPVARPAAWGALAGQEKPARAALARLRIGYVLFDKRQFEDANFRALAISSPAMRDCCLEQVYDDGRFAVYRVR